MSAGLRVATYNIHKGVRGAGPARRLEIHALREGVAELDADLVCLQEVRAHHHGDARRFQQHGWPQAAQADYLAPEGYTVAYRSNAYTRGGEHGNALLSRYPVLEVAHHDVSDHRLEQRGLLHVQLDVSGLRLHVLVVHFGLFHGSRLRQVQRLGRYLETWVPPQQALLVAGDFNDWREQLDGPMTALGLRRVAGGRTFPSRTPLLALDRVYLRGLEVAGTEVPRGRDWARRSDHLPLVVNLLLP